MGKMSILETDAIKLLINRISGQRNRNVVAANNKNVKALFISLDKTFGIPRHKIDSSRCSQGNVRGTETSTNDVSLQADSFFILFYFICSMTIYKI